MRMLRKSEFFKQNQRKPIWKNTNICTVKQEAEKDVMLAKNHFKPTEISQIVFWFWFQRGKETKYIVVNGFKSLWNSLKYVYAKWNRKAAICHLKTLLAYLEPAKFQTVQRF